MRSRDDILEDMPLETKSSQPALWSRRKLLSASVSAAITAAATSRSPLLAAASPGPSGPPLKALGARLGFPVGIAVDNALLTNPATAQIIVDQFNLITPGLAMKWAKLRPSADTFDFSDADFVVQFAQQHQLKIRGHNLCWNSPSGNPGWLKSTVNKSNARQVLTTHVTTVVKRYAGKIDSWDVVNEAVVPWPGRPDGLYPGVWVDALADQYIDIAFNATAQADPKALRVMNLHHLEHGTPDDALNRSRILQWLRQLLGRGVPIQAVGFESHLDAAKPLGAAAFTQFVGEIRQLGLEVLITELDVTESRATGTGHDWDVRVASYYSDYLGEVLSAVRPHSISFWSLKDRWENGRKIQGLYQDNLTPRLSLGAAAGALAAAK